MANDLIQQGRLSWSGEHWVNYIRRRGESTDSAMVSLYHTRYSPAGAGNVAFVDIPGEGGYKALCTDSHEVAHYTVETMTKGYTHPPYGQDLSVVDAQFSMGGDIRSAPSWTIQTDSHVVVATWNDILPAVITNGPWPGGETIRHVYSLLHFTEGASITLDGRAVEGNPYLRDIWRPTIGGDRSSCVFALAETFIDER